MNYKITEKDLEDLEKIIDYFRCHNKNLRTTQYFFILDAEDSLEDIVGRIERGEN